MIDFPVLTYDTAYPGICDPMPHWQARSAPFPVPRRRSTPKSTTQQPHPEMTLCNTSCTVTPRNSCSGVSQTSTQTHSFRMSRCRKPLLLDSSCFFLSPQVTWNPPDCSSQPIDGSAGEVDVRGLMPPAAWAHSPHGVQLVESAAAPPMVRDSPPPIQPINHCPLAQPPFHELVPTVVQMGHSARWNCFTAQRDRSKCCSAASHREAVSIHQFPTLEGPKPIIFSIEPPHSVNGASRDSIHGRVNGLLKYAVAWGGGREKGQTAAMRRGEENQKLQQSTCLKTIRRPTFSRSCTRGQARDHLCYAPRLCASGLRRHPPVS